MTGRKQQGFTLIELVGVLAIMAILAAVIVPPVFQQIDRAAAEAEGQSLHAISRGLTTWIRSSARIPAPSGWVAAVASATAMPPEKIARNGRGFRRGYYVDPRFFGNAARPFAGYVQTRGLTSPPTSPRIMIVSNLHADAPPPPATPAAFDAIWKQTAAAAIKEGPSVHIERMNLAPLFHHVLMANRNSPAPPSYRLNRGRLHAILPGRAVTDLYVLDGTRLSLYLDPSSGGGLDYAFIVREDASLMYGTDGRSWYWGRP